MNESEFSAELHEFGRYCILASEALNNNHERDYSDKLKQSVSIMFSLLDEFRRLKAIEDSNTILQRRLAKIEDDIARNNTWETLTRESAEYIVEHEPMFWYDMYMVNELQRKAITKSLANSLGIEWDKHSMNDMLKMVEEVCKKDKNDE